MIFFIILDKIYKMCNCSANAGRKQEDSYERRYTFLFCPYSNKKRS